MKLPIKIAALLILAVFFSLFWASFFYLFSAEEILNQIDKNNGVSVEIFLKYFLISLIASVPIIVIVWVLASNWVIHPIKYMISATKMIASGYLGSRLKVESNDEIGELAQNINNVMGNLVQALQGMANSLRETKQQELKLASNVKELAEARAKDSALLANIGDGVVAIDFSGIINFINKEAEEMLLYKSEEVIGKSWYQFLMSLDIKNGKISSVSEDQVIGEALKTGQKLISDCIFKRRDGSHFSVAIIVTPIVLSQKTTGVVVVFRDITKEKEVDRMKTEFISLASHQLRTPLSAIRWFSELLLDESSGNLNKEQKELTVSISASADRMVELVNSLLNISRIESGRIIIDPQPTDLLGLVKEVFKDVEIKAKEKNQRLIVSMHQQLPKINIDPKLIRQVYMNLLTNAVKYSPPNGDILVFISRKGEEVISQVSDSGYGIPKKEQEKVFQKFFRADNVIKVETDGNGLGLYLVKSIVESSNGRIWFQSEEGRGTTFWFSLPLRGIAPKEGEVSLDT